MPQIMKVLVPFPFVVRAAACLLSTPHYHRSVLLTGKARRNLPCVPDTARRFDDSPTRLPGAG